jgi:transposase InsO family protein
MTEARLVTNQWLAEYNNIRPHGSLRGMNPEQFLQQWIEGNETIQ